MSPQRHDLVKLAGQLKQEKEGQAGKKGIVLMTQTETASAHAVFDRKWTQEAAGNILDNAIKYSPPGSQVKIRTFSYEIFACIEIKDDGPGIAEEEIPLIFSRFYRGKNVAEQDGIGVGLFLARQIIEGEGGYIHVASKPGLGSCFQVFLPRQATEPH